LKTKIVKIGNIEIGGPRFVVIAGPCSIESEDQFSKTTASVLSNGACLLRGGLFKLRTRPNSFQGYGKDAFQWVKNVKQTYKAPFISEITDPRQIGDLHPLVDAFQVGSRNMHNYELLKELGQAEKPVILKRGFSGLINEWLLAAEYIQTHGNPNVILCERGIRTFETNTRNTFDLNAVAFIKQNSDLPILADPSHATGIKELVKPMSLASAAAGADGIMVEVHPNPAEAKSDGFQALTFSDFEDLMLQLKRLLPALDREI